MNNIPAQRTFIEERVPFSKSKLWQLQLDYFIESTYTAPGHATIATGTAPNQHGVVTNKVVDSIAGRFKAAIDDGKHEVFRREGIYASPFLLRVDTVGDRLKEATRGRGKVFAISHKDRAAILSGGKRADLVLWYDSTLPGFTTSNYYTDRFPVWLDKWQQAHPVAGVYTLWTPGNPQRLLQLLGPDDAPGEGNFRGFGTRFPHDPRRSQDPAALFRLTPHATQHMIQLTREAVTRLKLGSDEVADLLVISVSGTDYAGHVFGPDSWEYLDHLIKIDLAIGGFIKELSGKTNLAWILTSDHGVMPLPEKTGATASSNARVSPYELVKKIDIKIDSTLHAGDWILGYSAPFVYLSQKANTHASRDRIVEIAIEALNDHPGVSAAFDVRELKSKAQGEDQLEQSAKLNIHPDTVGDIFVIERSQSLSISL